LGIMQSVEPVLENAIKTLQKVVDVRGMGKKFLQLRSNIRVEEEPPKDNVEKAEEAKAAKVEEDAKKEEGEAAKAVKDAKAKEGAKGPDAAVAGAEASGDGAAAAAALKDDGKSPKAIPAECADLAPCDQAECAAKAAANVDPDTVARAKIKKEHEDAGKMVMAKSEAAQEKAWNRYQHDSHTVAENAAIEKSKAEKEAKEEAEATKGEAKGNEEAKEGEKKKEGEAGKEGEKPKEGEAPKEGEKKEGDAKAAEAAPAK